VTEAQVAHTLADLNEAMPGAEFRLEQVRHVFWGMLPGVEAGSDALLMHPEIIDHGKRDDAPGAWTVLGVKFTEAPFVANRVWNGLVGAQPQALPARPPAASVPGIDEVWERSDEAIYEWLDILAAAEWDATPEDLIWRRTDLWIDKAASARVMKLLTRAPVDSG
jgi:glycerol-3-phosphate dehydrogenase